ncbi:MAG: hypothetical protein HYV78_01515 [Candidatus Wildermuthbacteria bacterium]|nr:hypothetical protein [Candidatus Wildermuthbacteria bacterium]
MKFEISLGNDNIITQMRKFGYAPEGKNPDTGEMNFVKPLAGMKYPRFHVYCMVLPKENKAVINLHLDHKQPSYEGSAAHSGEYKGEFVEKEKERILAVLKQETG